MADNIERRKFFAPMLQIQTPFTVRSVDCPIYVFHKEGPAVVQRVINDNARQGRSPISVRTLSQLIMGEGDLGGSPLFCVTFDDGYLSQFQQILPILESNNMTATFFVMGGFMDGSWSGDGRNTYMTAEQLKYLSSIDFEIGSHTVTHRDLRAIYDRGDLGAVSDEVKQSKDKLEEALWIEITSFAYPNGHGPTVPSIKQVVADTYWAAVSTVPGRIQNESNLYSLRRQKP